MSEALISSTEKNLEAMDELELQKTFSRISLKKLMKICCCVLEEMNERIKCQ